MRLAFILAFGAMAVAAAPAGAQGLYIGAGAGIQWESGKTAQGVGGSARVRTDGGDTAHVALGTRFGPLRVEGELLRTGADNLGRAGNRQSWAGMANVLYDVPLAPSLGLHPYVGGGVGWMATSLDGVGGSLGGSRGSATWNGPAWQAMAGVAVPTSIDGLLMTAEYRATAPMGRERFDLGLPGGRLSSSPVSHSLLLGVRWEWESGRMLAGTPAMAAAALPVVPSPVLRSFSPRFSAGGASLTDEGRSVLERASLAARGAGVLIAVSGDGSAALAERRAQTTAGELVRHGVPQESITMNGRAAGLGNADGSLPEVRISWKP